MLNRIFKPVILVTLVISTVLTIGSCQKAKDTVGVVVVKDSNGNLVSGATVVLHLDSLAENQQGSLYNSNLRKTDITDASGRAEFTYELEAILQVSVTKTQGNNTLTGSNVIRLLKEKTVTQEVRIN
ncbi:MAG: hypothetical protein CMD15_05440 [Flavobacteriales bacterium]|nr:hypothetical protein [Flavobacteriales bacterium]|tara:strand:+ start:405062 stop:405442 length:381 start_codon:yes stop_codon:yes gene_type:complete